MIMDWITSGTLIDPYNEFFILRRSTKVPTNGMVEWWWNNAFVMRGTEVKSPSDIYAAANKSNEDLLSEKVEWVPSFLNDTYQKILDTGKCWHVL